MDLYWPYIIFYLLAPVFASGAICQEPEKIRDLEFFYIDDSQPIGSSGVVSLTEPVIERLSEKVEKAIEKKENNIWLYSSNRDNPIISTSAEGIKNIVHLLTDEISERPDIFLDKKLMRQLFYIKNVQILESVTFHFFVSGNFCKSIMDYYSNMLLLFPKELVAGKIITDKAIIEVNLYYSAENTFSSSLKSKLEESINFYNNDQFYSTIKLNIIEI